ncbi:uncharacterized protein LOC129612331 [Condylostylus longicornis]|uniref:uncharacterized protein LOC129612331 n=1 Tax=Condylostylus longicornis TaxID=2530218 RepID=UPI00244DFFF3|nr:uncharacterized protein LOC129612331 [Condylostylus longicornis]
MSHKQIQDVYRRGGEEVLGTIKLQKKECITEETWVVMEERKRIRLQLLISNSTELKSQHKDICRRIKKTARKASGRSDSRTLYQKINTLSRKSSREQMPVRNKYGMIIASAEEQLNRWREHFAETNTQDAEEEPVINIREDTTIRVPPALKEIIEAIRKLKTNKAEGIDGIPAELLKPIIGKIWQEENLLKDWKTGIIIKLPKKGHLTQCRNWRGITILNSITKVVALIIYSRIVGKLDALISEEQAGFRPGRGCTEHANTLKLIIEQSIKWNIHRFRASVRFHQAQHDTATLKRHRIPAKIII